MKGRRLGWWTTATVWVLLACSSSDPAAPDLAEHALIQTSETVYELRREGELIRTEISFEFRNETGGDVYLVNCNGTYSYRLDREEEGRWVLAWSPVLPGCLSPPIVIEAGATWSDTLRVSGALPEANADPRWSRIDPGGRYRLVLTAALSSFQDRLPFGPDISPEHRTSNAFRLAFP